MGGGATAGDGAGGGSGRRGAAVSAAAVRVRVWGEARLVGSGCGAAAYKRAGPRSPGRVRPEVGLAFFKKNLTCRKRKKRNTKQTPKIPK